jgi:hypothetical protein
MVRKKPLPATSRSIMAASRNPMTMASRLPTPRITIFFSDMVQALSLNSRSY